MQLLVQAVPAQHWMNAAHPLPGEEAGRELQCVWGWLLGGSGSSWQLLRGIAEYEVEQQKSGQIEVL